MADDQYRGLLTEREREILSGEDSVSKGYESRIRTRVRNKIEELSTDMEILRENQPELYEEMLSEICND
jgi:hypothetical protein